MHVIEEGDGSEDEKVFFEKLGGDPSTAKVLSAEEGGSDDLPPSTHASPQLFMLSDSSGKLEGKEVTERPLKREMLLSEMAFVLLSGGVVWAWVGRQASPEERKGVMSSALEFAKAKGFPNHVSIKGSFFGLLF